MKIPIHSERRTHARLSNPLHMIHSWSIEHPYVIIAFYFAAICLAGIGIKNVIPRRFAPYVPSPELGVVTMMPGLSSSEMELTVSKPIEEQLIHVKDLHYIRSTSQDGFSLVTLEFNYGSDMKKAYFDVQAQMGIVQANLPGGSANRTPSVVLPIDPLNLPVTSLALTGDADRGWTSVRLREFADNTVIRRLKTIASVHTVVPFGGYRRQMQVVVDKNKLAATRLSILDIRNAIDRANISSPAGNLTTSSHESIVSMNTRVQSAEDILNYPIMRLNSGNAIAPDSQNTTKVVTVKDVAKVYDSFWERRSAYHFLNHPVGSKGDITPSIEVSVIQDPGASSAIVMPLVMKELASIERDYPGVHFSAAYDNAHFISILFDNVWHELGLAILLTAITIFLFLGEWRGTLIALITVPTSLALAVLMMIPFGMTFNSGTLIGLLLCIGRLVDDTIIDIHSVERHLRLGKSPKQATIDGIAEVRLAVLASTLMLVLALTPLLFCGGITQLMFVELVWPIIFGLLASMLVSFTLTALLCANWLRSESDRLLENKGLPGLLNRAGRPFQKLLDRLERAYEAAIKRMLRNRAWNLARIAVTVIIGFTFYNFIGSEMMPLADVGQANGFLEMKPGTSFAQTEKAVKQLEKIMLKYPELERGSIEIGAETMLESWNPAFTGYQMPQANAASMMLTFRDKDTRHRTIWDVMDAIQVEALASIPGIRRLQLKEMGSDVMATSSAPIHLIISGPNLEILNQLGQQAAEIARHTQGLAQSGVTWTMGIPEYVLHPDLIKAQQMGVSAAEISEQSYYSLRGGLTNEFYRLPNVRQNTISIRYEQDQRQSLNDLKQVQIATSSGSTALSNLADIEIRKAPTAIEHEGLRRVIGISGYYRKGGPPSMDLGMDLMMKAMDRLNFPPGYSIEMRGDMTQMMDSFRRLLGGLSLSLIFMYLVLVAQFRGFLQPLQMLASLPLELAGVFLALWMAHQAFSTVSIMAIIVLSGMDITTSILMIDMIMKNRDSGIPRDAAVARACPERLRPILVTSLISMIVMLPVALAPRTGLDAYQPLGTTIVGGLAVGTVLSLFDIPLMHTVIDDIIVWVNRVFFRREWTWNKSSTIVEPDSDS